MQIGIIKWNECRFMWLLAITAFLGILVCCGENGTSVKKETPPIVDTTGNMDTTGNPPKTLLGKCLGTFQGGKYNASLTFLNNFDCLLSFTTQGTSLKPACTYTVTADSNALLSIPSFNPPNLNATFQSGCSSVVITEFGTLKKGNVGICGDGKVESEYGEVCDDGNTSDCLGDCSADCLTKITGCGDGIVCGAEQCDAKGETAACQSNCQLRTCGNGVLEKGEVCDDGNWKSGDGCRGDCKGKETCGDGFRDVLAGEKCDDGNKIQGDGCSNSCTVTPGCVCSDSSGCTQTFDSTITYQVIQKVEKVFTGATINGVDQYRTDTHVMNLDNYGQVQVVTQSSAAWKFIPVGYSGMYALAMGNTIIGQGGKGSESALITRPLTAENLDSSLNHFQITYQSTDENGDRFEIRHFGSGTFLCPTVQKYWGSETGLTKTSCTWLIPAVGTKTACKLNEYCGDGKIQKPEICDDGNTLENDACSADCSISRVPVIDSLKTFEDATVDNLKIVVRAHSPINTARIAKYEVTTQNGSLSGTFSSDTLTLKPMTAGEWIFWVRAVDTTGLTSQEDSIKVWVYGKNEVPVLTGIQVPQNSLNPAFNSNVLNYTATVLDLTQNFKISASVNLLGYQLKYTRPNYFYNILVASGDSVSIPLSTLQPSINVISIKIMTMFGVVKQTYTVKVGQ